MLPILLAIADHTSQSGILTKANIALVLSGVATLAAAWSAAWTVRSDRRREPDLKVYQHKDVAVGLDSIRRTFRILVHNGGGGAITIMDVGLREHGGHRSVSVRALRERGERVEGPKVWHRVQDHDIAEWKLTLTDYSDWDHVKGVLAFAEAADRFKWRRKGRLTTTLADDPEWHAGP